MLHCMASFLLSSFLSSTSFYSPNLCSPICTADNDIDIDNMSHILSLTSSTENLLILELTQDLSCPFLRTLQHNSIITYTLYVISEHKLIN